MTQEYADYLQTGAWQERRIKCMALVGNRCEACGQKPPLDIHHLTYARIYKEPLEDLMALCRPHHEYIESMIFKGEITRYGDVAELRKKTLLLLNGYSDAEMIQRAKKTKIKTKKQKRPKGSKLSREEIEKFFDLPMTEFKVEMNRRMRGVPNRKKLVKEACEMRLAHRPAVTESRPEIILESRAIEDKNVAAVRAKLESRMLTGLKKYGVTTERTDLNRKQWLQHAQEEAMDLAVYLERLIQEEG